MSILLSLPCVAAAAAAAGSARISHLHPLHSDRRRHRLRIKATTGCWVHIHYDEQTQSTDAVCSLVWLTDHLLPATRLISPPRRSVHRSGINLSPSSDSQDSLQEKFPFTILLLSSHAEGRFLFGCWAKDIFMLKQFSEFH